MWLRETIETIREMVKAEQEPLANAQECEAYAAAAYDYCVSLYGPPTDAGCSYILVKGVGNRSTCSYALRRYTIRLSPGLETREQRCMLIGHEMYHRVTLRRKGLRRQPWMDEMLAYLTSLWFLQQQGFSYYADFLKDNDQKVPGRVDLDALRAFRPPALRERLRSPSMGYPEEFYTDVGRLAVALGHIANDKDLCRIIKENTLEGWIDSLSAEKRYGVCRLLEMSSSGRKVPETTRDIHQFFNALVAIGDKASVVAELLEITRRRPSSGAAFFHLGRAYHDAKEFEAARDAYSTALDLNFPDKWLPYNLGSVCSSLKDYSSSVAWYQEATRQDPGWARALYFQGRALMNAGDLESARTAWEKTAGLDDEDCARWARIALKENPPPATADAG